MTSFSESERYRGSEALLPPNTEKKLVPEEGLVRVCKGPDPYVFKDRGSWHLLVHENMSSDGIGAYTLRSAPTLEELLTKSQPCSLAVASQSEGLKQVWAAEIHNGKYMYVAASDGDNRNHRMRVFETEGHLVGPWREIGKIRHPEGDDSWEIDLTVVNINEHPYAVWSGWEHCDDEFPQNLYIARMVSPVEVGRRRLLASPQEEWCCSGANILEGPQGLVFKGECRGLLVSGSPSWTNDYQTRVVNYKGGDPMDCKSWETAKSPLFPDRQKQGIGHGVIVEDQGQTWFVGHRMATSGAGWENREVIAIPMKNDYIEECLRSY